MTDPETRMTGSPRQNGPKRIWPFVGLAIAVFGLTLLGLIVYPVISEQLKSFEEVRNDALSDGIRVFRKQMWALSDMKRYYIANKSLPNVSSLSEKDKRDFLDVWGRLMRIEQNGKTYSIRSAGPDGAFGNSDDIVRFFVIDPVDGPVTLPRHKGDPSVPYEYQYLFPTSETRYGRAEGS